MNSSLTIGLLAALGAGAAVGVQGVFVNLLGQSMNPLRGGFAVHIGGTIIGAVMIGYMILTNPHSKSVTLTPQIMILSLLAGTFGMMIVMGIAIALPRIGYVAGQAAVIVAQLGVSLVIDSFALTGGEPIPIDKQRILGLVVVAIGTYLLLPQQNQ